MVPLISGSTKASSGRVTFDETLDVEPASCGRVGDSLSVLLSCELMGGAFDGLVCGRLPVGKEVGSTNTAIGCVAIYLVGISLGDLVGPVSPTPVPPPEYR